MFYCHYNFEMIYLWFKNYLKCVNTFLIIIILARWSKSRKFWTIKTCRHSLWTTMIQSGFQRLYKVIYWVNMFYSCPSFGQNSFTTLLFFPHNWLSEAVLPTVAKTKRKNVFTCKCGQQIVRNTKQKLSFTKWGHAHNQENILALHINT